MIKNYILPLFFVLWVSGVWGQSINGSTPAPAIPFNSNTSYPGAATMPTNLPTGGAYGKSQDAANAYNTWKTDYVVACTGIQMRVLFDDGTSTVSEGIGYGMLLAAYAGDKTTFDGFWAYYKANADANGLMNWKIGGCTGASGTMGATDGDEDAAMALLVAATQWPTATTPYVYKTEANTIITAINKCEIDTKTTPANQPSCGDGWINCNTTASSCRNPSYMAVASYKCFAASPDVTSAQSVPWLTVESAAQTLILANINTTTGLVSNWSNPTGTDNACNGPSGYGYDACRSPWRMAVDVAWYGDSWAQTICNNIATACNSAGAANVSGPVAQAGPLTGGTVNATFTSTFMAGCIGATTAHQAIINSMYTQAVATTDALPAYFGNTLRVLALFLSTGNFWNPCNAAPPCSNPNAGVTQDLSLCGATGSPPAVTLSSGLSTATNRTFHWYNNSAPTTQINTTASQSTQTTWSASAAGTYFVTVDSAYSSGTCSHTDTFIVTSTLPVPNLGTTDLLCTTTSYNLSPSNLSSFPAGTTWQWKSGGSNITGATNSTYSNVRTAGTYTLVASISGCASTSGSVTITSDLPTPVDGCAASAGQTAGLSIVPESGHTGDTYDWYSSATGGTILGTGTSFTTPAISATTTYYVEDASTVAGTVGPTTIMAGQTNWGINTGLHENFNATESFTINSVQVPLTIYTTGATTITIGVNGTTATYTSQSTKTSCVCTELVTFTFSPGIPISSGSNQYLVLTALTTSGSANPLWNNNTGAYPYNSTPSGIVSITGGSGGSGTTDYMFFYNWNISTGTACNRIPVIATIGGCTVTPVTFAGFNLANNGSSVVLYWATAAELNNHYFNVERSRDGYNFEVIGQVQGNGTSSITHTYSFTDDSPVVGTAYYHLAQYDFDGDVQYSTTLSTATEDNTVLTVAPNPFTHQTSLLISGARNTTAAVKLLDLTGKLLYSGNYSTNEAITLGSDLNVGLYIVQVQISDRVYVQKMIKQ